MIPESTSYLASLRAAAARLSPEEEADRLAAVDSALLGANALTIGEEHEANGDLLEADRWYRLALVHRAQGAREALDYVNRLINAEHPLLAEQSTACTPFEASGHSREVGQHETVPAATDRVWLRPDTPRAADAPTAALHSVETQPDTVGGHQAAFTEFYRATTKPLVAFLITQGADLALAADIAQETMYMVYKRWPEITHLRAWTYRFASSLLGRALFTIRETPTADIPEPLSLLRQEAMENWEQQKDVGPLLASLPHRQRQVMAWTMAGFTTTEIADVLGLTGEAVRANLRRARQELTKQFRGNRADRTSSTSLGSEVDGNSTSQSTH